MAEYVTGDFFSQPINGISRVLHGYSFRPNKKANDNDVVFASDTTLQRSNTTVNNFSSNSGYLNSGTLNLYENSMADVIAFRSTIKYNLIRSAVQKIRKKDRIDKLQMAMDQAKTLLERVETAAEQLKENKSMSKGQAAKAKEIDDLKYNSSSDILAEKLINDFYFDDTDYEKFPAINSNIMNSDVKNNMVAVQFQKEMMRRRLSERLVGYEAEIDILGEPYLDQTCINSYIYLKVHNNYGEDTFYTGIYQIQDITQTVQNAKPMTTVKLYKTRAAGNPMAEAVISQLGANMIAKSNN